MADIFDLIQLSSDSWQAKYHGNYGNYTIKLTLDDQFKVKKYSCTCPSDYSPCKHIGLVVAELKNRVSKVEKQNNKNQITVSDVLQNVSLDELRTFIIEKAKYNQSLTNDIMLKFVDKSVKNQSENENVYSQIIAETLDGIDDEIDDYNEYGEQEIDLSFFEEWLEKAKNAIKNGDFKNAELICKACIEEYATWAESLEIEIDEYIYTDYQDDFFDVLEEMSLNNQIDKKSLYSYCKTELTKKKYNGISSNDFFNNLMAALASEVNPEDFISSQLYAIKNILDKSSYEAKIIFNRLIDFYNANNQEDKAEFLIEENLQIDDFRTQVIEKRIANAQYSEAKKIINEKLKNCDDWNSHQWKKFLLIIAQKENDISTIRNVSFGFIEKRFDEQSFKIYKKTFSEEEWPAIFDKLYISYNQPSNNWDRGFKSNVAELLKVENQTERLLEYIEKHGSIQNLEQYYTFFSDTFPEKTLLLFQKTLNEYLKINLGRNHYEYANTILKKMKKIEGGSKVVSQLILNYRVIYKNRRAMMEIINKL
jgi:hypothetical protein